MTKSQDESLETNPPPNELHRILTKCRVIAVVGLSPKKERDSHRVAAYLAEQGYEIVPVNPGQKEILGKRCYQSLRDIPFRVDMADLFLSPSRIPPVVDQVIEMGIPVLWMQLGIVHDQAAQKAREAGITVVMNKCTKLEHQKMKAIDTPLGPSRKA